MIEKLLTLLSKAFDTWGDDVSEKVVLVSLCSGGIARFRTAGDRERTVRGRRRPVDCADPAAILGWYAPC